MMLDKWITTVKIRPSYAETFLGSGWIPIIFKGKSMLKTIKNRDFTMGFNQRSMDLMAQWIGFGGKSWRELADVYLQIDGSGFNSPSILGKIGQIAYKTKVD